MSAPRAVSALGVVYAPGGCLLQGGSAPRGCLLWGGVSGPGGVPVGRHTPVNILPCPTLRLRTVIISLRVKSLIMYLSS